jgi:hypothetical protein
MHRVCTHGPEDHELFRLVIVIADFADTAGRGAAVGQRVLAERVKVSNGRIRRLVEQAICEGWLAVETAGGPRRRAVYNLGPLLAKNGVTRTTVRAARTAEHESGAYLLQIDAQPCAQTVNGVGRSSSRRPPSRDGRATAVDSWPPLVPLAPPNRYRGLPDWTAQRLDAET